MYIDSCPPPTSLYISLLIACIQALVGYGCEDAGCGKCPSSQMIPMAQCAVGEWVSNTTGYFMYSVLNGLIPQSQDGGIIN